MTDRVCVVCHHTATDRDLCANCLNLLPPLTAEAYRRNAITTRQAIDCLRTRMMSVKGLHGGRHGRERRS